jgi:hypothetical protein
MVIVILDKSNSDNSDNGNKSNSGDNKGEQKKLDIFFLLSLYDAISTYNYFINIYFNQKNHLY